MGTRSITEVRSRWNGEGKFKTQAVVYRHWDGYLDGHGKWLFDFLDGLVVVNGIGGDMPERFANGPGRLAAQLVSKLQKDGHDPDLMTGVGDCGQEYHYVIDVEYGTSGTVAVTVFEGPMTAFGLGGESCTNKIFTGTVEEFGKFLAENDR